MEQHSARRLRLQKRPAPQRRVHALGLGRHRRHRRRGPRRVRGDVAGRVREDRHDSVSTASAEHPRRPSGCSPPPTQGGSCNARSVCAPVAASGNAARGTSSTRRSSGAPGCCARPCSPKTWRPSPGSCNASTTGQGRHDVRPARGGRVRAQHRGADRPLRVRARAGRLVEDLGAVFVKRVWLFIPIFTGIVVLPATFSFITHGHIVVPLGHWFGHRVGLTSQGLRSAALIVVRVATSISLVVLVALTTSWTSLLAACARCSCRACSCSSSGCRTATSSTS